MRDVRAAREEVEGGVTTCSCGADTSPSSAELPNASSAASRCDASFGPTSACVAAGSRSRASVSTEPRSSLSSAAAATGT